MTPNWDWTGFQHLLYLAFFFFLFFNSLMSIQCIQMQSWPWLNCTFSIIKVFEYQLHSGCQLHSVTSSLSLFLSLNLQTRKVKWTGHIQQQRENKDIKSSLCVPLCFHKSGREGGELHIAEVPHHGRPHLDQLPSVSDWEHTDLPLHRRDQAASAASGEGSGALLSDYHSPHSQTSTPADW